MTEDRQIADDGDISLMDLMRWVADWWWLLLLGAVIGCLLGLIFNLSVERRYTVRVDMTITGFPVASGVIIRDMSVTLLRRQSGTETEVSVDTRRNTLSLIERDVAADDIETRHAAMQNAIDALGKFLEDTASYEYALMLERYPQPDLDASAYAALANFRLFLSAVKSGLIEPVAVVNKTARASLPSPAALLVAGALVGAFCGALLAFALSMRAKLSSST